jgi:hypothetical protein
MNQHGSSPVIIGNNHADQDLKSVWHLIWTLVFAVFIALIPSQMGWKYGYTFSLALFVLPLSRLGWWLYRRTDLERQRTAWLISCSIILPIWCLLDIFLARTFFTFPNPEAHLSLMVPGYKWPWDWARVIPVEEFLFYVTGITTILLTYVWCSEVWMRHYSHSDEERRELGPGLLHLHWGAVWAGLGLFAAALVWKYYGPHEAQAGFPGYFLFLLATAIVPISMFVRVVKDFVNWQAFSFTVVLLLLISLTWEVTLGIQYGYWGFQDAQMMGLFIEAWGGLPIEEPLLWVAAAWLNVISYEVIRVFLATGRPFMDLFRRHEAEVTR